jgi:hypothetical protein
MMKLTSIYSEGCLAGYLSLFSGLAFGESDVPFVEIKFCDFTNDMR